jgi:hypothetical protein
MTRYAQIRGPAMPKGSRQVFKGKTRHGDMSIDTYAGKWYVIDGFVAEGTNVKDFSVIIRKIGGRKT